MLTFEFTQKLNRKLEEQKGTFWLPSFTTVGYDEQSDQEFEALGFKFGEIRNNTRLTTLPLGWKFKIDTYYFANANEGICLVDECGNRRVEFYDFPYFKSYFENTLFCAMELHPIPKNSIKKAKDLNEELIRNGFCIMPKEAFRRISGCNHLVHKEDYFKQLGFQFKETRHYDFCQMFLPLNWKFEAHFDYRMSELTGVTAYSVSIIDPNGLQRALLHCTYYTNPKNIEICCNLYRFMDLVQL